MANKKPLVNYSGDTSEIITSDSVSVGGVALATTGGPTVAEGTIVWDEGNGTAVLGLKGGTVQLQIGQEEVIRIYNGTGSTLSSGQIVYVAGAQGNRLSVQLASNSSEVASSVTIGMVTETILNGAEGFVTTNGMVNNLDTSALSEGVAVWLGSTAGTYTTTKPTAPAHSVLIGYVVRSHASVGSIFVHIQNGYELEELHDVLITSKADKDILQYESSTGLWKNVNVPTLNGLNVSTNSSSNAVTISQTGSGNALVVEDIANPDSTPFVIDANGIVLVGSTTSLPIASGTASQLQVHQTGFLGASVVGNRTDTVGAILSLGKSRGSTPNSVTSVQANDSLGQIRFAGADGTTIQPYGVLIDASVDGTPATNSMPGRLTFHTTPSGSATPVERMRIDSNGNISFSSAGTISNQRVRLAGDLTQGSTVSGSSFGFVQAGTVQSDVSNLFVAYRSEARTAAASFTLGNYWHYQAAQPSIGASSAIATQIGFIVYSTLTGATNNYGFFGDIPSGTGRWNFYANGTADNYFAGPVQHALGSASAPTMTFFGDTNTGIYSSGADTVNVTTGGVERMRIDSAGRVGIGSSSLAGRGLRLSTQSTGSTISYAFFTDASNAIDVTTWHVGYGTSLVTANPVSGLYHFTCNQGTLSGAVTNQYGFAAGSTLIGATNNYGFISSLPSGTGRWNFYANGTAANYFNGQVTIGTTSPSASAKVQIDSTTQGFLPPRMTTTERDAISSPAAGLVIYNTTTNKHEGYNGTTWNAFY